MDPIRFEEELRVTIQALGGETTVVIFRARTISPQQPSGISANLTLLTPHYLILMS
jgi:hypothetical protein